jgi:hypothetical protein
MQSDESEVECIAGVYMLFIVIKLPTGKGFYLFICYGSSNLLTQALAVLYIEVLTLFTTS